MHDRLAPARGFLRFCAGMCWLGILLLIAGNIIGSTVVPGHDAVADTVSDLAAGEYEYIQDIAFYGFAVGVACLALALAYEHPGGWQWSYGVVAILVLALLIVLIGARNEYGDGDDAGFESHIYLVYALTFIFLTAPLALRNGLSLWHDPQSRAAMVFAVLWLVLAPVFFVMPTAYDGLYERALGVLASIWLGYLALGIWRRAT